MYRQVPNLLTVARLVLAFVFFLFLNWYRYPVGPDWALWVALIIFIIATITDYLDGMLARKWNVESQFGRIMDPFCDKVLILGAFIYLSGPRFVDPVAITEPQEFAFHILRGNMVSGVYPWMVAMILARELLVTGIRGELEAKGVKFGAAMWGKVKFMLQAIVVPIVLLIIWLYPRMGRPDWLAITRNVLVYITVIVSLISGWPYVTAALKQMREEKADKTIG
ncbi:MAG: CDP-alcohol phosphatidyltransferase family protein [Phycisphaeraceae bacterium]